MRIVFMGTPEFAVPSLNACASGGHEVALVVTQPPRGRGRGRKPAPSAIRRRAEELGLPVLETERVNREEDVAQLRRLQADLFCVTAFGQILSAEVLALPALGCVNVHASLLPRWRGAAPIHRAILAGDTETGVTTMFMVQKMDAGDAILQRRVPIGPEQTQEELSVQLAELGGCLLAETLALFAQGEVPRQKQDEAAVTYAPMLKKEDGRVDWRQSARQVCNLIRGTIPWPGAFTFFNDSRLRLWSARPASDAVAQKATAGELAEITTEGIVVGTGKGAVLLTEVQPQNKRRMSAADWTRGARVRCGDLLR